MRVNTCNRHARGLPCAARGNCSARLLATPALRRAPAGPFDVGGYPRRTPGEERRCERLGSRQTTPLPGVATDLAQTLAFAAPFCETTTPEMPERARKCKSYTMAR